MPIVNGLWSCPCQNCIRSGIIPSKCENIKSGVSIFGVTGSMTDYAFENWTFTLDDDSTVSKSVAVASLEE